MVKQKFIFLAGVLILALVLVGTVSADTLIANSVTSQSATVNSVVTTPPSVKVINGTDPVSGVSVIFTVTNGGGSISSPATVITGPDGVATIGSWTLGTVAGTNTLTATSGSLIGSPLTFTATGTAGGAATIVPSSILSQSAPVSTVVSAPPTVVVKDVFGNPVSGATVAFQISSGGGMMSSTSATSGANGNASVGWTLGSAAGLNSLIASFGSSQVTFSATGTAGTTTPTVTGISPNTGYNTSAISPVIVSGTSFSTTAGYVVLKKAGETTNITGSCSNWATTSITCSFPITGRTAGAWDVVVINLPGWQETVLTSGFTINSPTSSPTLSSISPSSAATNTTVSITSLVGTNFASTAKILLRRSNYNDVVGSVSSVNADHTVIAGSFSLNNQPSGSYQVCVYNDATATSPYICGLTFTITSPTDTATNSSVYFESNPSGATIYLNGTNVGTTVLTYYNATPGTHKVLLQKSGYRDYSGYVTVITGRRVSFYASLAPISADTTAATPGVTASATPVKTTTTIKKSTLKVPTTWASTPTATESPVDPVLIIGAVGIGLGLVVVRRR